MTAVLDAETARTWIRRWDAQQERYVTDREERFAVIADVVESVTTTGTVLDLGCGPGSLSARLARRLPGARIIGLDTDPLLLGLGRGHYRDRIEFVDFDLATDDWPAAVPDVVDAAVSTTALHWLDPAALAGLYRRLAARLRPGGVFVNGDHLPVARPELRELARLVTTRRAVRAGVSENEDWQQWWAAARADTALAPLLAGRPPAGAAHHGTNSLTVADHVDLLLAAGFTAAAPVWQSGEDHVLTALR